MIRIIPITVMIGIEIFMESVSKFSICHYPFDFQLPQSIIENSELNAFHMNDFHIKPKTQVFEWKCILLKLTRIIALLHKVEWAKMMNFL